MLTPFNAGSPEAARAEVEKQKAAGTDFIKVGLVSPDVFWAILQAAKKVGLHALGHLQVGVDPARASREGFHSIEHLGPGDPIWIACSSMRDSLFAEAALHPAVATVLDYLLSIHIVLRGGTVWNLILSGALGWALLLGTPWLLPGVRPRPASR